VNLSFGLIIFENIFVNLKNKLNIMRTKILMPQYEPTDKELNDLMKEVVAEVKVNALKTKILIENNILLEIEKVKATFKSR
jgi:hypothetical protein